MSELRFVQELGAEFERINETSTGAQRSGRGRRQRIRVPRPTLAGVGLGLSVLVVLAVVAVGFGVRGPNRGDSSGSSRGVRVVFSAIALDPRSPWGPSIQRSIDILRGRLAAVSDHVKVWRAGTGIVVQVPDARGVNRAQIVALAVPGRLEFYDWEADALTPKGNTVASQLPTQDPNAVNISQGTGSAAPGEPGAGSVPLYDAVKLAAQQPPTASKDHARDGKEYYLFGAPGSAACAATANDHPTRPVPGVHCLLSGPIDETTTNPRLITQDLASGLPAGVTISQGQQLVIPQGTVVLLAAPPRASPPISFSSPTARFYVLKDHVAQFGPDITNPHQSTDQSGNPDVQFGFSSAGAAGFQRFTATIAHRGSSSSRLGQSLNQHFAVALDNKLITVSSIDFKTYPDGISGGGGADLTGGFTTQSARALATILRFGPLPVRLAVR